MYLSLALLIVSFVALLLLDVPIPFTIGLSTVLTVMYIGDVPANYIVAQRMSTGIASFPLLAIPFFILAGILMGEGGMARRLIDFASILVGRSTGGLAYVSTLTCMMFGAISGSATAAVSSVGGMIIPEMERKGFDRDFSVAVTTVAATTGMVIPPSNIMIVYAVVAGSVSVAAMFTAGIFPGLLIGLGIMAVCWLTTRHRCAPAPQHLRREASWFATLRAGYGALPSLALIVIVLAGILGGAFSATEAAAIAVLYAFVLAVFVYREVSFRQLPRIFLRAGLTTATVMLLIGTSQAMSWVLAYENIPQSLSAGLLSTSDSPIVILLIMNGVLLFVGTFMDMTPAVLIFAPIFLPVVHEIGMHPVHFGIMLIANLCIGLCTPPVGTCLFVGCGVGQTTLARVTRPMVPFFLAMLVSLVCITFWPGLSLWLPRLLELD